MDTLNWCHKKPFFLTIFSRYTFYDVASLSPRKKLLICRFFNKIYTTRNAAYIALQVQGSTFPPKKWRFLSQKCSTLFSSSNDDYQLRKSLTFGMEKNEVSWRRKKPKPRLHKDLALKDIQVFFSLSVCAAATAETSNIYAFNPLFSLCVREVLASSLLLKAT